MQETLKRTLRTFVQSAVGYFAANLAVYAGTDFADVNVLKTVLMGALVSSVAAGLAAAMNLPKGGAK